ncbi:MAG: ATP-binding cassette domain-containing protein [Oscillospiraceae bacterium]|nr:ATP-binding cassette domain-containing protein [Oscillospiraceae bacterium]
MGWFEKQIKQRNDLDQQLFEDSFFRAAGVILGDRNAAKIHDDRFIAKQALDDILKYYHIKPVEIPASVKSEEEQIDYCLRPHGIMKRLIKLEPGWYKDSYGPVLGYTKDGEPTALLPDSFSGYYYTDSATGRRVRIGRKNEGLFDTDAYCFYKPLPLKKLGIADLLIYMKGCLSPGDVLFTVGASAAVTVMGLFLLRVTKALTGPVAASGNTSVLPFIAVSMLCAYISSQMLTSVKDMLMSRIQLKTSLGIEASMMMRVLSLPASFFRRTAAGELTSRLSAVDQLCTLMLGMVFSSGLTSLMSLLYVTQIFSFAPGLVVPSLLMTAATVIFGIVSSVVQIRISRQVMEHTAKESGMSYSMITGVQKIKLAGAEKRMFARWLGVYAQGAAYTYAPPMFIKMNSVIAMAITSLSSIILYSLALGQQLDQSSYYTFMAAYGALTGAFSSMGGVALSAARIRPILETAEPFLRTEPEAAEGREIVTKLSGAVELNNIYFRYGENMPYIIEDLTLKVKPGEYVAIVGRTGCGKSTLMRLLLGFEKPEKGAVYYDSRDLNRLDLSSLRRRIGTVMQDGGLFQGDIYSNIVISAPGLTLDDAWAAAEKAGLADDIRAMPMGMHTVISEGQGGISGGQKQRIMIARAVTPDPKILMFDEATSALDNKTQREVCEALDAMDCTRIVIAHRLSTIRRCDRILVLDGGRIAEDGTYDELIAQGGIFAELVERQRI